jgi:hypothetical protein
MYLPIKVKEYLRSIHLKEKKGQRNADKGN